jgi:hypothetical protein
MPEGVVIAARAFGEHDDRGAFVDLLGGLPIGVERPQILEIVTRTPTGPLVRDGCPCSFVPLIGVAGWPNVETEDFEE